MQAPAIQQALLVYAVMTAQTTLFVAFTWALAAALGGRATAANLGIVRLFRFKLASTDVQLGLLPAAASVTLLGRGPADLYDGPGSWRRLGLARRLAILLGPWLVTLAVAAVCLAPARALTSFLHAVPQVLFVLDPTPLVRGFLRVLRTEPSFVTLGVVCAKLTALNLLPLPALAGGAALHEIRVTVRPPSQPAEDQPRVLWLVLSILFVLFYMGGRFLWAFIRALSTP